MKDASTIEDCWFSDHHQHKMQTSSINSGRIAIMHIIINGKSLISYISELGLVYLTLLNVDTSQNQETLFCPNTTNTCTTSPGHLSNHDNFYRPQKVSRGFHCTCIA